LKRAFPAANLAVEEDGEGGARFILSDMAIGDRYVPAATWLGAHIPALYPYADIYPVFMDAGVRRADGVAFVPPITPNASFMGRPAIQISRRNNLAQQHAQTALGKILKILKFLEVDA
ncbi:MAG TPA: hypothetical protein VI256_18440, partial [Roseiarcus sp.]